MDVSFRQSLQTALRTLWHRSETSLYMHVWLLSSVEHIVARGGITHYDNFLILSQCFKKPSALNAAPIDKKG